MWGFLWYCFVIIHIFVIIPLAVVGAYAVHNAAPWLFLGAYEVAYTIYQVAAVVVPGICWLLFPSE